MALAALVALVLLAAPFAYWGKAFLDLALEMELVWRMALPCLAFCCS